MCGGTWDISVGSLEDALDRLDHIREHATSQVGGRNRFNHGFETADRLTGIEPSHQVRIRQECQQGVGGLQPFPLAWSRGILLTR